MNRGLNQERRGGSQERHSQSQRNVRTTDGGALGERGEEITRVTPATQDEVTTKRLTRREELEDENLRDAAIKNRRSPSGERLSPDAIPKRDHRFITNSTSTNPLSVEEGIIISKDGSETSRVGQLLEKLRASASKSKPQKEVGRQLARLENSGGQSGQSENLSLVPMDNKYALTENQLENKIKWAMREIEAYEAETEIIKTRLKDNFYRSTNYITEPLLGLIIAFVEFIADLLSAGVGITACTITSTWTEFKAGWKRGLKKHKIANDDSEEQYDEQW
jgi:hypothetical protein